MEETAVREGLTPEERRQAEEDGYAVMRQVCRETGQRIPAGYEDPNELTKSEQRNASTKNVSAAREERRFAIVQARAVMGADKLAARRNYDAAVAAADHEHQMAVADTGRVTFDAAEKYRQVVAAAEQQRRSEVAVAADMISAANRTHSQAISAAAQERSREITAAETKRQKSESAARQAYTEATCRV